MYFQSQFFCYSQEESSVLNYTIVELIASLLAEKLGDFGNREYKLIVDLVYSVVMSCIAISLMI